MSNDPLGKRALFSAVPEAEPAVPAAERATGGPAAAGAAKGQKAGPGAGVGRRALYSSSAAAPSPTPPARQPGTVVVECRRCRARVAVSLPRLLSRLIPSLWLPFGRYNRWMRCPSCSQVSWCRIEWPFPLR